MIIIRKETIMLYSFSEIKNNCVAKYKNMELKPLTKDDIENLRQWRNDPSQTQFLRQIGHITPEMQLNWYNDYLEDQSQIVFAIHETESINRMVGSVALYGIKMDEHVCEVGKIQIGVPEAHGKGLGRVSLVAAIKIAFRCLGIEKIVASVHQQNVQAHTNDLKIGFRIVGEIDSVVGGKEDLIEMLEEDAQRANKYYEDIELSIKSE